MSTTAVLIAFALVGALAVFILLPIFSDRNQRSGKRKRDDLALETLLNEKMRVMRAIRDLDFDYDMGKLPDTAYTSQRINLFRLAVALTRRIDALEAETRSADMQIEEAVAAFRHARQ
jgi:hypothetical protein